MSSLKRKQLSCALEVPETLSTQGVPNSLADRRVNSLTSHGFWIIVYRFGPTNWAALQAVEQPSPPVPLLFLKNVLVLQPSSFSQLGSKIRVADPHGTGFLNHHCNSGPLHLCSLTCWRSAPQVLTVASSSFPSWPKGCCSWRSVYSGHLIVISSPPRQDTMPSSAAFVGQITRLSCL